MRDGREETSRAYIFKNNIGTSHPGRRNKANLSSLQKVVVISAFIDFFF